MGNAKSRAAKQSAKQEQQEANVAAGSAAAPTPIVPGSKQALTDVERTAVGVSWLRWQASRNMSTKGHTPPSADGDAQPLYDGSFDEKLCEDLTEVDAAFLSQRDKNLRFGPHVVAVRTVALDDALMRATGGPTPVIAPGGPPPRQPLAVSSFPTGTVRQVAILGAGLDARAWRLPWPQGVTVFEVDSGSVEALKQRKFGQVPTRSAARHALVADLNNLTQVREVLTGARFKASEPTAWVLEGLIGYLTREAGLALLRELKAQSAPGSYLLLTCPPTPEEKRLSDQEGYKLYHAHFEEPEDTQKRVVEAGWATAELITTERLREVYGIECKQPQVHAIA